MTIGFVFWLLMLLWLIFGLFWQWPASAGGAAFYPVGGHVVLWILLFLAAGKRLAFQSTEDRDAAMNEIRGNLWDYWNDGHWVVITTNGSIRTDGLAVMGRGVAREAAIKFPNLAKDLADRITHSGNRVHVITHRRLFAFPVKTEWNMGASLQLIEHSAAQLANLVFALKLNQVYMVRPGCGNGGLNWDDVKPVIARHLDDRFVIVEMTPQYSDSSKIR